MKFKVLIAAIIFALSLPVAAEWERPQQSHEARLSELRLPQNEAGTVGFKPCEDCAYVVKRVDANTEWVLDGQKLWITNGNEAGMFIVFATVDPEAGYKGITAFVVERGQAGFSIGKKEDKLGIRASSTTELLLDGCRIPTENVLGEVGKGYKIAIETLNEGGGREVPLFPRLDSQRKISQITTMKAISAGRSPAPQ